MQQVHYKSVSNDVYVHSAMDLLSKVRLDQLSSSQREDMQAAQAKLKSLTSVGTKHENEGL